MTPIYFSSFDGPDIDTFIKAINDMHLCIVTTGSSSGATVNCKCTALNYNQSLTADSNGKCVFIIPGYGNYKINNSIDQPVYEFKVFQVSLV